MEKDLEGSNRSLFWSGVCIKTEERQHFFI